MIKITPPSCQITSDKKVRESGIELLRIVAMFLVLVVHANFFSLGEPQLEKYTFTGCTSVIIQCIAIVCVNVFVMISGWFGIKPKAKGISAFLFQVLFFFCGILLVLVLSGLEPYNIKSCAYCLLLLPQNWFIKAYLLLYIIAPVLNAYCEHTDRNTQRNLLIFFYCFQTLYGWAVPGVDTFGGGYSTISFIGLYLLMQYVRKSKNSILNFNSSKNLLIFLLITGVSAFLYIIGSWYGIKQVSMLFCYNNPLVIIASLNFFLSFRQLKFTSKTINWVAGSAFAVYLLHTFPPVLQNYYKPTVNAIFKHWNGIDAMMICIGFMALVFMVAILIDQLRKFVWVKIENISFR